MQQDCIIPEDAAALFAQAEWVRTGKRRAMLVPSGSVVPPLWHGANVVVVASGLVIYNDALIGAGEIEELAAAGKLAQILDYPVDGKPDQGVCVTIRDRAGREKQSVVVAETELGQGLRHAQKLKDPGDGVTVDPPERIVLDRLKDLERHTLVLRRLDGDPTLAGRLAQAALADNHRPLLPTLAVLKGDAVVGYVCIDSLPLCRIWLSSSQVKAPESVRLIQMLENVYRMRGTVILSTIMNVDSPFYQIKERLGYLELPGDRIMLKIL